MQNLGTPDESGGLVGTKGVYSEMNACLSIAINKGPGYTKLSTIKSGHVLIS